MIAIRSMRTDFQIDIFWASSIRSKLAQRLSAVAVSGEISNFGWAYFYRGDSHFVWETAILYGHHPQLRHGGSRDSNPRKKSILGSTYQLGYSTTGGRARLKLLI